MALIKCEECGQMVSDKAENCPNCGAPVEKKIICPECGNSSGLTPCPTCGYKFDYEEHRIVGEEDDNGHFSVHKSLSNRQVAWGFIKWLALLNKIICSILAVVWFVASVTAMVVGKGPELAIVGIFIGVLLVLLVYGIYVMIRDLIAFIAVALETSDDIRKIKRHMEKSKKHRQ